MRKWDNVDAIYNVMTLLLQKFGDFIVIEGEASGADIISRYCAEEMGLSSVEKYPADWFKYGKAAGHIRNKQMLTDGKPNAVFAFHTNLQHSKGTRNMVEICRKSNIPVWVFGDDITSFIEEIK